jgi:hypothetical protein
MTEIRKTYWSRFRRRPHVTFLVLPPTHPPIHGATAPSGPWPPSEDPSILLCLLLSSSILVFLGFVMCPSERRPPILFLVFPLVLYYLTPILLMWRTGLAPNSIPIYSYIQQDATLHSLFISGNCSTCFGWFFHPSSEAHTTVSTASGICHTVTAICRLIWYMGSLLINYMFRPLYWPSSGLHYALTI